MHRSTARILALLLLGGGGRTAACPVGEEKAALEHEILSAWQVPPEKLDYVVFTHAPDATVPCVVLVSVSEHGTIHAEGGTIGVVELVRAGDRWRRGFEQRGAFEMGGFGHAPKGTWLKLGRARTVLAFEIESMHFGYVWRMLVLGAKLAGRYEEIVGFGTRHDNSATGDEGPGWGWSGTFEPVERAGAEFPDLCVSFCGTEERGKEIVRVDREELLRFDGKEYRLQSEQGTPLPW